MLTSMSTRFRIATDSRPALAPLCLESDQRSSRQPSNRQAKWKAAARTTDSTDNRELCVRSTVDTALEIYHSPRAGLLDGGPLSEQITRCFGCLLAAKGTRSRSDG